MILRLKIAFVVSVLALPVLAGALTVAKQWQAYGNSLYNKGDTAGAVAAYQKSLQADPNNKALADFVAKISPNSAAPSSMDQAALEELLDEVKNLLAEHKFEEALASLQKAPANSASVQAMLGDAYYGLGLASTARKAYQRSLALEQEQPRLKSFVAAHLPPEVVDESLVAGEVNHFAPLWRSAIVPGWGQVYNGQASKGLALGIATLGLLGGAYSTYQAADSAYNDYSALGPGTSEGDFNTAYDRVQNWAAINHVLTVLFYAAYVYNVGDAAAGARPEGSTRAELHVSPQGTPQLALSKRF